MCTKLPALFVFLLLAALTACDTGKSGKPMDTDSTLVQLITLDPGHFHAALVQKSTYPGIDSQVYVYAPEGPELQGHLNLINSYNDRTDKPTMWAEKIYTGNDFLEKMVQEKKGNVVVIAGNNRRKVEYITNAVNAGMNVLGDKPMAIDTGDFKGLINAFEMARNKGVLLYDIMTERSEITNILQRELSQMPELFGELQKGTVDSPAVVMESVHHFYKQVSGSALKRPAWFFDADQQGNAIVDVGTHLVDLVQWQCFPETAIDHTKDIQIQHARRWPAPVNLSQFKLITKLDAFPAYLSKYVAGDTILNTDANGMVNYTLKGIHVSITALWNYQAPEGGGDTHYSLMKGTRANLVIRQGKEEQFKPSLYIEPVNIKDNAEGQIQKALQKFSETYPGITVQKQSGAWKLIIPQQFAIGHEAHFGQVMERYLQYLKDGKLPDWEVPGMISKYYVTTYGSAKAKEGK